MGPPLEYQSPAHPSSLSRPNVLGIASCAVAAFLIAWFFWGTFRLVDAFYSGPGGAPYGPAHRPWWYIIYGGGAALAMAGVSLGVCALRDRSRSKVFALIGVIANSIGLVAYASSLPYPN